MSKITPFHLAFPVKELKETEKFYTEILGCSVGRKSELWIDFNLGGNQITAHLKKEGIFEVATNFVDGDNVPVRHFGLILEWNKWEVLSQNLQSKNYPFLIEPHIRFKGKVGEQATFFIQDPSGNVIEMKSFKDLSQVFNSL